VRLVQNLFSVCLLDVFGYTKCAVKNLFIDLIFYVYITYKTKMPREISQKVKDRIIGRLTENNAEFIAFEKGRKVKYRCSCGNESASHTSNIGRSTWKGTCAKC